MSVNVRIQQKALFKKKLNIENIIEWTDLDYGVFDQNFKLVPDEIGDHTIIYDKNKLARGIDVSTDGSETALQLSSPTSPSEIRTFYDVIDRICSKLNVKKYIREEEKVSLADKEKWIKSDEQASVFGLEVLQERIGTDENKK